MAELWLSAEAFLQASGMPKRTFQWRVKQREIKTRATKVRGRNGRLLFEYAASSLAPNKQLELARMRLQVPIRPAESLAVVEPGSHDAQIPMFVLPPNISEEQRLAIGEKAEQADQRLEVIAPLIDFSKRTNGHRPVYRLLDGREVRSLEGLAQHVASQHGLSSRTIWDWYSRYRQGGYHSLADDARSDKGTSRWFRAHPEAQAVAQQKYFAEGLSLTLTAEALARAYPLDPPSYKTVERYLKSVPKPIAIMARDGEAEFHERCAPFLLTDFRGVRVNQIWVSDHGKHDVWVRNDRLPNGSLCFMGIPEGAALRPWLTAIEDMRSRKIVGAVWNATPNSHTISSALRQAITAYGLPETFYIDNGKDYEAVGRIDFSPECSGVLSRLGIRAQYCIPKHPQSKLIESWFATLRKRSDILWRPFYCGGSIDTRPEDCDLVLKEHSKLAKQGNAHLSPLPAASEFIEIQRQWVEDYNAAHPHSGRGMDGKTPDEVFAELPAEQRRMLGPDELLAELFWKRDKRRVLEGGCIELNNARYEPADPTSSGNLFMMIERDVLVACDPCNLGEALVFDLDGRPLGRMQAQKLIMRGPVSRDDVRAGMRKQRLARRAVKDYIQSIANVYPTELDGLRRRAGLPEICDVPMLPSGAEVLTPLKRAVGAERLHIEDAAARFLEGDD